MVRLSLRVDTEKKTYVWKVLDEKHPGLIIIETNKGKTTIRNPPLGRRSDTFQHSNFSKNRNYLTFLEAYPYLPYLWVDATDSKILNPITREWMSLTHDLEGASVVAAFDILDYDIIERVGKAIPSMNQDIIAYESERAIVEKEFQEIKMPVAADVDKFLEKHQKLKKLYDYFEKTIEEEAMRYHYDEARLQDNMKRVRAAIFEKTLHLMAHPEEIEAFVTKKDVIQVGSWCVGLYGFADS